MASIVERTTKKGERRLYITFGAVDRSTGVSRKVWLLEPTGLLKEAKARKAEVEIGLRRSSGVWPLSAPPSPAETATVEARGREWVQRHRITLRERVAANYISSLENHIYPLLGARRLDDLGPADAKLLRDTMRARGLSDDTIRAALSPLRGLSRDWAEDVKRPDPLAGLRLFGKSDAARTRLRIVPPEAQQIAILLEHARPSARDAICIAAATGLRRGELFAIRWRDVDFAANELHVSAYNFGGHVEDGRTKTEAGDRDVPLFRSVRKVLLERKAREAFSDDDDFVFGTTIGTPMEPNNFVKRELKPALVRAGLPSFRWHSFRHYAVSVLISQGADILTLARIAGHSDPSVTLKVYGHLMRGSLGEAAEKYEPLLGAVAGSSQ